MTRDDNDALRDGTLPFDPFVDAVPITDVDAQAREREARGSQAGESQALAGVSADTLHERAGGETSSGLAPDALAHRADATSSQAGESQAHADARSATEATEVRETSPGLAPRAPDLPREALHGLAGEIVNAISPHTEAHPAALLVQLLVGIACLVGRGAHFAIGATRHYLAIFSVLVGTSAKARKGTSWDEISYLLTRIDPEFAAERVKSGLVSGEGIVYLVRDDKYKYLLDAETKELKRELVEEGVRDKRLLIQESEFARVLTQLGREGNTLSAVIRDAWDGRDLATLGRNAPLHATAPHVAIVAHITQVELMLRLSESESANGFANRFLWALVHRSKLLPSGGALPDAARDVFADRLRAVVEFARTVGRMTRDADADALWTRVYTVLSAESPGQLGMLTARAPVCQHSVRHPLPQV